VIEKTRIFWEKIALVDPKRLRFYDETGTKLNMTRTHARSVQGERAVCKRSAKYQTNITIAGMISPNAMEALYPYDGSFNGERYMSYLSEHLIPVLKRGDVLVMDNVRMHHIPAAKEMLKEAGIELIFLPPYSPDLNPIEEAWSVVKNVFRKLEAKNISEYIYALREAIIEVTPQKLKGFFRHAGYAQAS
jgi:transposase